MRKIVIFILLLLGITQLKLADEEIVVTMPILKFIVDKITQNEKLSMALLKEDTDAHFFDAKLTHMVKLKNAKLLILMQSSDMEVYVDALLQAVNNKDILKGNKGYLELANFVDFLQVPVSIERTAGELHAAGNTHFYIGPDNFRKMVEAIFQKLKELYPEQEKIYKENKDKLLNELDTILFGEKLLDFVKSDMLYKRWKVGKLDEYLKEKKMEGYWRGVTKKLNEIRNEKFVSYHKSFTYFLDFFKLEEFAVMEPKPGIPPSTSYLLSLIDKINKEDVKVILVEPFYPVKTAEFVKEKAKKPLCIIVSSTNVYDYFKWLTTIAEKIYKAVKENKCE